MNLQNSIIAGDVLFSSTVSTDKIVAVLTGSYNASNYTTQLGDGIVYAFLYQKDIVHNFTRPAFIDLLWSTDGINYLPNGTINTTGSVAVNGYSDSSNIYILANVNTGTIYYKILATWIDDYDGSNPLIEPTLQTTDSLYFDSRHNYQKIFSTGSVTANSPGSSSTSTKVVVHNLGYTPNFRVYFSSLPKQVWPSITGSGQDTWLYANTQYECYGVADNTILTLTYTTQLNPADTVTMWYKIYYDR